MTDIDVPTWHWISFIVIVLGLIALDMGILNKKDHVVKFKESLTYSIIYTAIGYLFGVWVWYSLGAEGGQEYIAGFTLEKMLALDNIFVISMIFGLVRLEPKYQNRILSWAIVGAIGMRAIFVFAGVALIARFTWMLPVFGLILILTGVKMLIAALMHKEEAKSENKMANFLRKFFAFTDDQSSGKMFVLEEGKRKATPLFIAVALTMVADLIFSLDSVPAIFAITTEEYVVYSSNVLAVLGLRSLYFLLNEVIAKFYYLKHSLAVVLILIGIKPITASMLDGAHMPTSASLLLMVVILGIGVVFSVLKSRKAAKLPNA